MKNVDTGLSDEIEAQVAQKILDLVIDQLLAAEELDEFRPPAERLQDLEARVKEVKAELGFFGVALYRLKQRRALVVKTGLLAASVWLVGATVPGGLSAVSASAIAVVGPLPAAASAACGSAFGVAGPPLAAAWSLGGELGAKGVGLVKAGVARVAV